MGFYISLVFNKTSALTIYGQLWMRQKTADNGSHHQLNSVITYFPEAHGTKIIRAAGWPGVVCEMKTT